MPKPFEIQAALRGAKLITTAGKEVVSFFGCGTNIYRYILKGETGKGTIVNDKGVAIHGGDYNLLLVEDFIVEGFLGEPGGKRRMLGASLKLLPFSHKAALKGEVICTGDGQVIQEIYPAELQEMEERPNLKYWGLSYGDWLPYDKMGGDLGSPTDPRYALYVAVEEKVIKPITRGVIIPQEVSNDSPKLFELLFRGSSRCLELCSFIQERRFEIRVSMTPFSRMVDLKIVDLLHSENAYGDRLIEVGEMTARDLEIYGYQFMTNAIRRLTHIREGLQKPAPAPTIIIDEGIFGEAEKPKPFNVDKFVQDMLKDKTKPSSLSIDKIMAVKKFLQL